MSSVSLLIFAGENNRRGDRGAAAGMNSK